MSRNDPFTAHSAVDSCQCGDCLTRDPSRKNIPPPRIPASVMKTPGPPPRERLRLSKKYPLCDCPDCVADRGDRNPKKTSRMVYIGRYEIEIPPYHTKGGLGVAVANLLKPIPWDY